jgi:hypothetical protein
MLSIACSAQHLHSARSPLLHHPLLHPRAAPVAQQQQPREAAAACCQAGCALKAPRPGHSTGQRLQQLTCSTMAMRVSECLQQWAQQLQLCVGATKAVPYLQAGVRVNPNPYPEAAP